MSSAARTGGESIINDPAELLLLATSRPQEAEVAARSLLLRSRDARARTYAYHAIGIVRRDANDLGAALRALRVALRTAERHALRDRAADVGGTLGTALAMAGRIEEAVAAFDAALLRTRGLEAAKVRMRRGAVLAFSSGRRLEALADFRAALRVFRRHGDRLWEARTLENRGWVRFNTGDLAGAEDDLRLSERVFLDLQRPRDAAEARHNLADVARLRGDLPAALEHLDIARDRYAEAGAENTDLHVDRAALLLEAGLVDDARRSIDEALALLPAKSAVARRAAVLIYAAEAARRAGDVPAAEAHARESLSLHRKAGNPREAARSNLARVRARAEKGTVTPQLLRAADKLADSHELGHADQVEATLLAARIARALGHDDAALHRLNQAARRGRRDTALVRSRGSLAAALRADLRGRGGDLLRACEAGLAVLDEHRLTLGATEMRAAATAHGTELAELGIRHALASGDPLLLMAWSERWRATALSVPPVRPPDDRELAAELSVLRDVTRRIDQGRAAGEPTEALERELSGVEDAARARTRRTRGDGATSTARHEPEEVLAALGPAMLVELVAVDGRLNVVVGDTRGGRGYAAGSSEEVAREVDLARFALHRISRPVAGSGGAALARGAAASLDAAVVRLEQLLLGDAVDELRRNDGPLLVVPPGRLHAVPWGLLPSMHDRAVTVAPSAAVWLRGRNARAPRHGSVVLVTGPNLGSGGAEVPALVPHYPLATVLGGGNATSADVLDALDGSWLAHIAAHGSFRADNPMFSALYLDDGPLTVHDLCRLRHAPYRVVLSSCESGLATTAGADELLGLASALVPLGTAGILASVVPVNDEATVPLMVTVHEQVRAGATLAEALQVARAEAGHEPVARATAAAFVALGSA